MSFAAFVLSYWIWIERRLFRPPPHRTASGLSQTGKAFHCCQRESPLAVGS